MSAEVEKWRVNTVEGVFETDLETLKQWIHEGCVQPTDKVSKGNLSWIEAGRAPVLRSTFNGEVPAPPSPPAALTAVNPPAETLPVLPDQIVPGPAQPDQLVATAVTSGPTSSSSPDVCYQHPERPTKHTCRSCHVSFCEECTKFVGTSKVAMCPLCGDLCKLYEQQRSRALHQEFQGSGFGFSDFARALRYPLQHKVALLFGAGFYGFCLLAGFRGRILASVIMFGCISHVISQVAWGRLNRSFLPDFSAFSLVDDLVMPLVLGIGITIVTWGPAIVLFCVLIFGVVSGGAVSPESLKTNEAANSGELNQNDLATIMDPNADPQKQAEASKKLDQLRPGHQIAKDAEKSQKELSDPTADLRMLTNAFKAPILIILLLLLSLAWGIFYYPMALAVAGYTETFGAVINPLVGLDTIRRMGGTYFKAFGMVLLIQVVGLVVGFIVAVITAPFALAFFGNLPAMFIDGAVTFYFNLVVACILGLALFKCADRVGISTD